jgi:hypothetical protein
VAQRVARWSSGLLVIAGCCGQAAVAGRLALSVDDIVSPSFHAKSISAALDGVGFSRFTARIGELSLQGRTWRNARLTCPKILVEKSVISCADGTLQTGETLALSFRYDTAARNLDLTLRPSAGASWRVAARFGKSSWRADVNVKNGNIARLSSWIPDSVPKLAKGVVSGDVQASGNGAELREIQADLRIGGLAFSDAAGLHAGERVGAKVVAHATKDGDGWLWNADIDWREGEIFWQPLYFATGGHRLSARGRLNADSVRLEQGTLQLAQVGSAEVAANWDRAGGYLRDLTLRTGDVNLDAAYKLLLQPFLQQTALAQLETAGRARMDLRYRDRVTQGFDLELHDARVADARQRFALEGVDAAVHWLAEAPGRADISFKQAELLRIPLGATRIPLTLNGMRVDSDHLEVPVLDGKLSVDNLHAEKLGDDWQWRFSGGLTPVSMQRFTEALQLPPMHGTLSAVIPKVSYAEQSLKVGGALLFKVFDGTAVVQNLVLLDPFGRAPRLGADLDMRNLDLDLLTRTFSFGNMQGLIDVSVKGLQLANWKPVRFDARVASSPGSYPKKISQTAVQNISALGGGGAAAAIQRSFLRFFEQFGYDKIGLSCVLRNGVCVMDGVEEAPHGFVIVKGGGIPAITVIGYNRSVSWDELLQRLARITQSNVKPVVQ